MRRFYVPPELSRGDVFELPEREARHAAQVLRLATGEELTVLDGAGGVLTCRVESTSKRSLRVSVRERRNLAPLPCAITLIQALPKGPAFETIVQKATELGAACIIPLMSERVVAHISEKDAAAKVEKWRQIAIESIKQCGSPWLPVIEKPVRFEKLMVGRTFLSAGAGDFPVARSEHRTGKSGEPTGWKTCPTPELSLVCSLEEPRRTLREAVEEFQAAHHQRPASAAIWIGPEGDFTPAEYAAIAQSGVVPITLGPLVLRADTAAIACLAVANHELQAGRAQPAD
jgi:16S rRNA (uracil1498-N3)-methyltransferase